MVRSFDKTLPSIVYALIGHTVLNGIEYNT
jgi:hypothetical protein